MSARDAGVLCSNLTAEKFFHDVLSCTVLRYPDRRTSTCRYQFESLLSVVFEDLAIGSVTFGPHPYPECPLSYGHW